jgi:DNA-binding transcriptional LysR family regulator
MELVNQVDSGEIDMAAIIRPPFSLHSDLRWTTLAREPYRLIVPVDMPGDDWSELVSSQPFIRYDRSSFGGRQVDRFLRQTHVSLREVCELDELDAIIKLVANGVGVALVPETATHQGWPADVRAVDLKQRTFHRDIGLVHRARRSLTEPVKVLVQLITEQVQKNQ